MPAGRPEIETVLKTGGVNHLAFAVEDLEVFVAALGEKGVEIVPPPASVPNDSGDRFAVLRGNARILLELFQPAA